MERPDDVPTELAQGLALQLAHLDDEVARQLSRFVDHLLASTPVSEQLDVHLGLIMDMIRVAGELPKSAEYDEAYAKAVAAGRNISSRTALRRAYGDRWEKAVYAAVRRLNGGSATRVPTTFHHGHEHLDSYTQDQVAQAFIECAEWLEYWPTQWEYLDWAAWRRAACRAAGKPSPRLPTGKPVRDAFDGSWARADAYARERYATKADA